MTSSEPEYESLVVESTNITNISYVRDWLSRRFKCVVESYNYRDLSSGIYFITFTCDKKPLMVKKEEYLAVYTQAIRLMSEGLGKKRFSYPEGEDVLSVKYAVIKNVIRWFKDNGAKFTAEEIMSFIRNDQFYSSPDDQDILVQRYPVTYHLVENHDDATRIINYLDQVKLEAIMIPYKGKVWVVHEHGDVLSRDDWKELEPVYFTDYGIFQRDGATGLERDTL